MSADFQIKVLGGSASRDLDWRYAGGFIEGRRDTKFNGIFAKRRGGTVAERFSVRGADELTVADEAAGVRILGAAGWGALGTIVAGPVGAVVGGILGGRGENITFLGKFGDHTMLGQVPKKVWLKMIADRI